MLVLHPLDRSCSGVSPSSCPRRKKEPPQLFHFVDAERRRRLVKNLSIDNKIFFTRRRQHRRRKGKPVDFYDEIIARNDALVDIMLEKIRRRESNSDSNYNGDSLHREESGK